MRTALPLLVLALAGCLGGGAADGPAEGPTAGVLRGVVVDQAIRPLGGANVTIGLPDGTQRADVSDLDGRFAFTDLQPGTYLVQTVLAGYFTEQTQANVTAADADALGLRIVLELNHTIVASVDAYVFDGYLQCSVTAVAARQACDADEALAPACEQVPCGDLSEDRFMAVHAIGRGGMAYLQSELQWDPSSGLGGSLRAVPGARDPVSGQIQDFEGVEGPAPLIVPLTGEVANALAIGNGKDYAVRVFSSYDPATQPPCLPAPAGCPWGVGVAYQQRFSMVTHVFYGFSPPEGWQFGRDGVPAPPA